MNALLEINAGWEGALLESEQNLQQFGEQMGIAADDADQLSDLAGALQAIVDAQKNMQIEERELFELSKEYQRITRASVDELEITTCRRALSRIFDKADALSEKTGLLASDQAFAIVKAELSNHRFLNSIDESGNPKFDWEKMLDYALKDGVLTKYELLDLVDELTDSWYFFLCRCSFAVPAHATGLSILSQTKVVINHDGSDF